MSAFFTQMLNYEIGTEIAIRFSSAYLLLHCKDKHFRYKNHGEQEERKCSSFEFMCVPQTFFNLVNTNILSPLKKLEARSCLLVEGLGESNLFWHCLISFFFPGHENKDLFVFQQYTHWVFDIFTTFAVHLCLTDENSQRCNMTEVNHKQHHFCYFDWASIIINLCLKKSNHAVTTL